MLNNQLVNFDNRAMKLLPNIRFKKANSAEEYLTFISGNPGIKSSMEYLKQNDTYLLYKDGEAIGGFVYATNKNGKLRYFEGVKDEKIKAECYQKFTAYELGEIGALWLKKEYRKTQTGKLLWLAIGLKTLFSKADYYIFGTTAAKLNDCFSFPRCSYKFLECELIDDYKNAMSSFFVVKNKKGHLLRFFDMCDLVLCFAFKKQILSFKDKSLKKFHIQ